MDKEQLEKIDIEILNALLESIPRREYFSIYLLIKNWDETHHMYKVVSQYNNIDTKITSFLFNNAFVDRPPYSDSHDEGFMYPLGYDITYGYTGESVSLTDKGRELKDARSYERYIKIEEIKAKKEKKREKWKDRKMYFDAHLGMYAIIISCLLAIAAFFGWKGCEKQQANTSPTSIETRK